MTDGDFDADVLDATLATALKSRPDAVLAALADDGSLVAVPQVDGFIGHPVVPVPDIPAGMLGLVLPADQTIALSVWDRCRRKGVAKGRVRLLVAPDRPVRLLLVDARHRYGVRICVMDQDDEGPDDAEGDGVLIGSTDALRPRIATSRMSQQAVFAAPDEQMTRMLGWSAEDLIGQRPLAFVHPDDHERAIANWLDTVSSQLTTRVRVRYRRSSGEWLWVEVEHTPHLDPDPEVSYVTAQFSDISDEMSAHEAVDQREKLFRRLTESLPMGLFLVHTDGTVGYANSRLPEILGVPSASTLTEQLANVAETDRAGLTAAFTAVLTEGLDLELEIGVRLPDRGRRTFADERRCRLTLTALSDQEGLPGAIVTVSDVTEAARMREELQVRATFDHLTGCHNRDSTMAALGRAIEGGGRALAVVFVDLDGFKPINDELGHAAGDELLQHAATSLNALPRAGDLVGRIGGDEFLLIFRGASTPAEALAVGERVSAALHHSVAVAGTKVELRASVGVALAAPGLSADALVALADAAMYESKRRGGGTAVLSRNDPEPNSNGG